jgi:diphthamide biosynthesis protein 2
MTENNTFSSSGQDVIAKSLDVVADHDADALDADAFGEYYEIARTVEEIVRGSWKRVRTQPILTCANL